MPQNENMFCWKTILCGYTSMHVCMNENPDNHKKISSNLIVKSSLIMRQCPSILINQSCSSLKKFKDQKNKKTGIYLFKFPICKAICDAETGINWHADFYFLQVCGNMN